MTSNNEYNIAIAVAVVSHKMEVKEGLGTRLAMNLVTYRIAGKFRGLKVSRISRRNGYSRKFYS